MVLPTVSSLGLGGSGKGANPLYLAMVLADESDEETRQARRDRRANPPPHSPPHSDSSSGASGKTQTGRVRC